MKINLITITKELYVTKKETNAHKLSKGKSYLPLKWMPLYPVLE